MEKRYGILLAAAAAASLTACGGKAGNYQIQTLVDEDGETKIVDENNVALVQGAKVINNGALDARENVVYGNPTPKNNMKDAVVVAHGKDEAALVKAGGVIANVGHAAGEVMSGVAAVKIAEAAMQAAQAQKTAAQAEVYKGVGAVLTGVGDATGKTADQNVFNVSSQSASTQSQTANGGSGTGGSVGNVTSTSKQSQGQGQDQTAIAKQQQGQGQLQGQGQEQGQGQTNINAPKTDIDVKSTNINANDNTNIAKGGEGGTALNSNMNYAQGGQGGQGGEGGKAISGSYAQGGDAYAKGGDAFAQGGSSINKIDNSATAGALAGASAVVDAPIRTGDTNVHLNNIGNTNGNQNPGKGPK